MVLVKNQSATSFDQPVSQCANQWARCIRIEQIFFGRFLITMAYVARLCVGVVSLSHIPVLRSVEYSVSLSRI